MLHMKMGKVLTLRPGFFTSAPADSCSRDLSDQDQAARTLMAAASVHGSAWSTTARLERFRGSACPVSGLFYENARVPRRQHTNALSCRRWERWSFTGSDLGGVAMPG